MEAETSLSSLRGRQKKLIVAMVDKRMVAFVFVVWSEKEAKNKKSKGSLSNNDRLKLEDGGYFFLTDAYCKSQIPHV